jgi:Tol biopolymer transport system component
MPRISADGEIVVFQSDATNLLASGPPTDGGLDGGVDAAAPTGPAISNHGAIYAHARSGGFERLSRPAANATGPEGDSRDPAVSANGTFVAFSSRSEALVGGDDNAVEDIFVTNRVLGVTLRVSVSTTGEPANGPSRHPSISNDGRYVAFESTASNLVPGDDNGVSDVFLHDLITAETSRVSVTALGAEANGGSFSPDLSGDGKYVAFESLATNLLSDDEQLHGVRHVYLTEPRR